MYVKEKNGKEGDMFRWKGEVSSAVGFIWESRFEMRIYERDARDNIVSNKTSWD